VTAYDEAVASWAAKRLGYQPSAILGVEFDAYVDGCETCGEYVIHTATVRYQRSDGVVDAKGIDIHDFGGLIRELLA
jgi:hypothetical protein